MSAPRLSSAERAVVDRFDAADPAPESLRERVARAMFADHDWSPELWDRHGWEAERAEYRRLAEAAIAVMRGES